MRTREFPLFQLDHCACLFRSRAIMRIADRSSRPMEVLNEGDLFAFALRNPFRFRGQHPCCALTLPCCVQTCDGTPVDEWIWRAERSLPLHPLHLFNVIIYVAFFIMENITRTFICLYIVDIVHSSTHIWYLFLNDISLGRTFLFFNDTFNFDWWGSDDTICRYQNNASISLYHIVIITVIITVNN